MNEDLLIEIEDVLATRRVNLDRLTVGQLLASQRLPETMFQPYLVNGATSTPIPLSTPLADVPEGTDRLLVRAIRNTLFPTVVPADPTGETLDGGSKEKLELGVGFRQIRTDQDGLATEALAIVDREQARRLVIDQVTAFASEYGLANRGCVFGVSGGGDSNALAYGLAAAVPQEKLLAFTLVFDAVFSEKAAERATVLCQDLGIRHQVMRAAEIETLLGITTSLEELYEDFKAAFTHEALHFFGTFLILRTARKLAVQHGLSDLAFGYNREDLLAEALFMLMNGNKPLALPVRPIGSHRVVMPVWQVPKLLLDACHPGFSLENYRERDPFTTRQRSLAFFLAHALDSAYPSFGLSLLKGIATTFDGAWGTLVQDDELDVFVTEQADDDTVASVRNVLARHFA
ncbi:hypothetical protein [Paenarthrobacter ureafaciens]|uniref:hypothetical protein n=1 Tax=Paenarthrobacter ureafaciens TaxID=37931 RepID=UPI001FB4FBAF|nr:hypothetical protein [Paenarthrobacter ureafaciens]UOD83508.1 hypothetical protein MQZ73_20675 [Paenarthrobacter ureafaciens]